MRRTSRTAPCGVKALRRTDQTNIAFFNQVRQRHATVVVVLADGHHETKVGSNQPILGFMATIIDDGPSPRALRAASKDWCDQSPVGNARVLHGFWTCWPSQDRVILHHIRRNSRNGSATEINRARKLHCQMQKPICLGTGGAKFARTVQTELDSDWRFCGSINHWQEFFPPCAGRNRVVTPSVFLQPHQFDGWKASSWTRNPTPPRSGEVDRSRSTRPQFC